jgi:hypothetical protein
MSEILDLARLAFALPILLLAPGLSWSFYWWPRIRRLTDDPKAAGLDWIERLALAFGLSVATLTVSLWTLSVLIGMPVNAATVLLVTAAITLPPTPWAYKRWKKENPRPHADYDLPEPAS